MTEARNIVQGELELLVSRREMIEILSSGDRTLLSEWLAQQRVEGPGLSMSLAEYVGLAGQDMEGLDPGEQGSRMMALEAHLLGLELRDFEDRHGEAPVQRLGEALRTRDTLDLLFGEHRWYGDLNRKSSSGGFPPNYDLPLEHRRYKKSDERYTINPGRIGPNFVHTWALDLVNVTGFRIRRTKPNNIALYSGQMGDDTLTVIDSCGYVLQTFTSQDFFSMAKIVDLQNRPPCPYDARHQPYTRIYLILETSPEVLPGASRWFTIEELEHVTPLTGNEHAYVVADEINYDYFDTSIQPPNNNDFVEALDEQGNPVQIYPPWAGGKQGANSKLGPEFKTKPSTDRGWYLLGLNTTYADQKFYSVVYYNERRALLRVYLYSLDEGTEFTAHVIKVYLEGCTAVEEEPQPNPELPPRLIPTWEPLKGAFFPIDANPKNWWRAELVVGGWAPHTWTAVEVPMLYPMGSNLPAVGDHAVGRYSHAGTSGVGSRDLACKKPWRTVDRYRSVYEDQFAPHQKNARLVVAVRTFHQGYADLSVVASAIGDAVQQVQPGTFTKLFDGIKTGKDWFGYATDFGKLFQIGLDKRIENAAGAAKTAAKEMKDKIETTFNIIGAATALAGALLKVTGVLSDDVLTLAICLSIQGKITGTLTFQDVERENRFYLPGRFSIADAFAVDGIATDNIRVSIDSCLARYDRTLGLFGYAYQPWDVEVNLNADLRVPQAIVHTKGYGGPIFTQDNFFFPARHQILYVPASRATRGFVSYEERLLPDLLPVIVNPRAEIDVIPSQESKTYEYVVGSYRFVDGLPYHQKFNVRSSEIYLTAHDRANWRYWWTAWSWTGAVLFGQYERRSEGNTILPPPRVGAQPAPNPNLPPFRVNVMSVEIPLPETSIKPLEPRSFHDRRGVHVETAHQYSTPTASYAMNYVIPGVEELDPTAAAPMLLTDVIYVWNQTYLYWGDTRYPAGQAYPRVEEATLSTPASMRLPLAAPPKIAESITAFMAWATEQISGGQASGDLAALYADWLDYLMEGELVESSLLRW